MTIGDTEAMLATTPLLKATASVDDDLPQALADTVTGLLGAPPRARGWIHLGMAALFIVTSAALVPFAWVATSPRAGCATLVYGVSIVAMFSVSAIYHRVRWQSLTAKLWMKRADHSLIFVFIAGSYTPFALLAMPTTTGRQLLVIVYTSGAAGVALKMLWPSAPAAVGVPLYLLIGWVAICYAPTLLVGAGIAAVALLLVGAILYNIGAVLYALCWPNPWPRTFGYHEFFHAFTAVAAVCHFIAIVLVVG